MKCPLKFSRYEFEGGEECIGSECGFYGIVCADRTNGIDGETNGIADEITLPEGDAVKELREFIDDQFVSEKTAWTQGMAIADMVKRDYVSRQDFDAQHRTLCAVREQRDRESEANRSYARVIAKLESERDELKRQLDTMRDVARDFRDERDEWKRKAEAKSDKRAAAVERLKDARYHTLSDYVRAMLGWGHEPHFDGCRDALIDLLTDDDAHSKTEPNLTEQSESLSDEADSREKLEADVEKLIADIREQVFSGREYNPLKYRITNLLDRQAAITKLECIRRLEGRADYMAFSYKQADEERKRLSNQVEGLFTERDELQAQLDKLSSDELHWHSEADYWKRQYELICKAVEDVARNYTVVDEDGEVVS